MRYDVIALGELLIDFTENGLSARSNPVFEANPGGAPCNVLAMLSRLGKKTSFLGVVGKDSFGTMLCQTLKEQDIDTGHLLFHPQIHTTLAFVHTLDMGERDFTFYRSPGADTTLSPDQVEPEYIKSARAFHFGTLSMTHSPAREATYKALEIADKAGILRSFDPNLRPPLWDDLEEARRQIAYGLSHCDILKISEEEVSFMTGLDDPYEGARLLKMSYPGIRLMNVTLGRSGSISFYEGKEVFCKPFLLPDTVDTTGAGDTFGACALAFVLDNGTDALTEPMLLKMLRFANAAAALVTTRKGALKVMPTIEEINGLCG